MTSLNWNTEWPGNRGDLRSCALAARITTNKKDPRNGSLFVGGDGGIDLRCATVVSATLRLRTRGFESSHGSAKDQLQLVSDAERGSEKMPGSLPCQQSLQLLKNRECDVEAKSWDDLPA